METIKSIFLGAAILSGIVYLVYSGLAVLDYFFCLKHLESSSCLIPTILIPGVVFLGLAAVAIVLFICWLIGSLFIMEVFP